MVSTAAAVARLNPKTQDFERTTGGEYLRGVDVAHVLGCLKDDGARYLARVKWAHQPEYLVPLELELLRWLSQKAMRQNWRVKPGRLERMTMLALREMHIVREVGARYEPGREVCYRCRGTKQVYSRRHNKWFDCDLCVGTGVMQWTENRRAGACDIHHQSWASWWSRRYDSVQDKLRAWESDIHRVIRTKLGEW